MAIFALANDTRIVLRSCFITGFLGYGRCGFVFEMRIQWAAWINVLCVGLRTEQLYFPALSMAAHSSWRLVMWLKAINHQSVSRGTPDSRAGGRAGAGRVKKAFSRHSLAHTPITEDQGHPLPTDPWALSLDDFWFSCMSGSKEYPLFIKAKFFI